MSAVNALEAQVAEHPGTYTAPESDPMIFQQSDDGDYRIYVGAVEAARGDGYIAAVVVQQVVKGARAPRETYRDDALACGHQWSAADGALVYAMRRGREVVAEERRRLYFPRLEERAKAGA